ncbi:MAG: TRAP transporter large permease subunit [Myxococcota bacterium]
MNGIGGLLSSIDGFFRRISTAVTGGVTGLSSGPLQGALFWIILVVTGFKVVVKWLWSWIDRGMGWAERILIVAATLGMTALVFDSYLIEQTAVFMAPAASEEAVEPETPGADEAATPQEQTPASPPEAPAAAPEPAPTPTGEGTLQVVVTGDGEGVSITGDAGTFDLPASVPAGLYQSKVSFPGYDAPLDGGELDIRGDGPVEVKCSSFAESCRVRKNAAPPKAVVDAAPVEEAPPEVEVRRVPVTVRGGGTEHTVLAGDESIVLPGDVPVGSWTVQAVFPEIGVTNAGTLLVAEDDASIGLWCSDSTWQCLPDEGWWNPWKAEGQVNLALMLMVALGFLGASIATQDGNHLSVDAADRVLSPGPAKFVKRLTATVASGFCAVMAYATWAKIIDPDASGDTFPGAKVWWWMATPLNWLTNLMPGDTFGPGGDYPSRSVWEEAMIAEGKEWPFGLAYETVEIGSAFPLWVSLLILLAAFGIMAVRFGAIAIAPPAPALPELPTAPKPSTRRPTDVILAGAFPGAIIALGLAVWLGQGWMIIVASLLLVFMGAPRLIGVGIGTLAGWMLIQDVSATSLVSDMFEATKKQEIIAIPFFVLAGNLMTHGSIARRLIDFARAVVGPTPGGLGVAGVVACAIFAAISGSSPATVIAIGAILFPMLVKQGYDEKFSLGLLTTSGGLGIIIPPSVPMIIFAVMVSNPGGLLGVVSPIDLFLGGFAPGMLIAGALMVYTMLRNWPRPGQEGGPLPPGTDPDDSLTGNYAKDLGKTFIRGLASLLLPVLVLGGIYGGSFGSPFTLDVTQAAAFAVVYALFVEVVVHRELKLKEIPRVCIETASMIGSLFLILVIAISLNKLLAELEVPQMAAEAMLMWADDPLTFLLLVNLFLLALGTVMDIVSAILIVAPLLAPIAAQYGIHPIHFGIMFIVNLELGYLTPPMGINLFVASTTFKRNLIKVIQGVVPFLVLMLFCLAIIIWVPRWSHSLGFQVPGLPALLETQVGKPSVEGPREPKEISRIARRELKELRGCAPAELTRRGSVVLELVIDETGAVTSATATEVDLQEPKAAECFESVGRALQFDPLPEGTTGVSTAKLPLSHIP